MYNINILHLIEGAKPAKGLTVIIDVFRAFSLECYGQDLTQGIKSRWTASRDGLSSQRTSRRQIPEQDNRQILIFYGEFLWKLILSGKTM